MDDPPSQHVPEGRMTVCERVKADVRVRLDGDEEFLRDVCDTLVSLNEAHT